MARRSSKDGRDRGGEDGGEGGGEEEEGNRGAHLGQLVLDAVDLYSGPERE